MVTTLRLPLDLETEAGERDLGRTLTPENSPETLPPPPPAGEGTKPVERETLAGEIEALQVLNEVEEAVGATIRRWSAKLEDAVATSIAERFSSEVTTPEREREREDMGDSEPRSSLFGS